MLYLWLPFYSDTVTEQDSRTKYKFVIVLVQKIPVLEFFSEFSSLWTEKSVLTCASWEQGWSHVITRMVLDDSLKIFPLVIHRSDIHTGLVFCEVTYAGHSVLCFIQ
jgi:5-methylthioribose kinase